MIWADPLPGPRTITIVHDGRTSSVYGKKYPAQAKSAPIPQLIHVCKDSRRFAMQHYSLSFGPQLQGRPIYFDCKRDLLYIAHRASMQAFYGRFSLKERPDALHEMEEVESLVSMDK